MRKERRRNPVDRLRESHDLLSDIIRNHTKIGYIAILIKAKPKSREIINLKLLDFKK